MTTYRIENINNDSKKIIISRDHIPYGKLSILFLFAIAGIGTPIIATLMLEEGEKQKLLLSYLLMWGTSVYLFRLILWNIKGKQVIELNPRGIDHHFDYSIFKDRKFSLERGSFHISTEPKGESIGRLIIHHNDKITVSPFELSGRELLEIEQEIEKHLTY